MRMPDATTHNPDPGYIRELLDRAGISQRSAARVLGVDERTMRRYVAAPGAECTPAPYLVQYALEVLADRASKP